MRCLPLLPMWCIASLLVLTLALFISIVSEKKNSGRVWQFSKRACTSLVRFFQTLAMFVSFKEMLSDQWCSTGYTASSTGGRCFVKWCTPLVMSACASEITLHGFSKTCAVERSIYPELFKSRAQRTSQGWWARKCSMCATCGWGCDACRGSNWA